MLAKTVSRRFPPLAMTAFNRAARQRAQDSGHTLQALHNSEPEPLSQTELTALAGQSVSEIVAQVPLGYAPDQGTEALRRALAQAHPGLTDAAVITTAGAQEALTLAMHVLIEPGDKAVVITPVFEPILRGLEGLQAAVKTVTLRPVNGQWQLDLDELFAAMGTDCRLLVVNFPHNPTGHVIPAEKWQDIQAQCRKHGTWLISDEVFRGLEQNAHNRLPPAACCYDKAISIGVTAKSLALPGLRVGWMACQNAGFRQTVLDIKQYLSICNSQLDEAISQKAIARQSLFWERNRSLVKDNVHTLQSVLDAVFADTSANKPQFIAPVGGNTAFILLDQADRDLTASDATHFCEELISTTGLLCYPGKVFASELPAFRVGLGYGRFAGEYRRLCEALVHWLTKER